MLGEEPATQGTHAGLPIQAWRLQDGVRPFPEHRAQATAATGGASANNRCTEVKTQAPLLSTPPPRPAWIFWSPEQYLLPTDTRQFLLP